MIKIMYDFFKFFMSFVNSRMLNLLSHFWTVSARWSSSLPRARPRRGPGLLCRWRKGTVDGAAQGGAASLHFGAVCGLSHLPKALRSGELRASKQQAQIK
jgi:hypothetical protein